MSFCFSSQSEFYVFEPWILCIHGSYFTTALPEWKSFFLTLLKPVASLDASGSVPAAAVFHPQKRLI